MDELSTQMDAEFFSSTLKDSVSSSALLFASPPASPLPSPLRAPSTPLQSATQLDAVSPLLESPLPTQLDERPSGNVRYDPSGGTQLDEEYIYVNNDEEDEEEEVRKPANLDASVDTSLIFDHSTQEDSPGVSSPRPKRHLGNASPATQLDFRSSPLRGRPGRSTPTTPMSPSLASTQLDNPPASPLSPYSSPIRSPSDFGSSTQLDVPLILSATQLDGPAALCLASTQEDSDVVVSRRRNTKSSVMTDSLNNSLDTPDVFASATQPDLARSVGPKGLIDGSDSLGSEATQIDEVSTLMDGSIDGSVIPLLSGRRAKVTISKTEVEKDQRYDEDLPTQLDEPSSLPSSLPSSCSTSVSASMASLSVPCLAPFEKGELYDPTPPFDELSGFKHTTAKERANKRKREPEGKGTTTQQQSTKTTAETNRKKTDDNAVKKRRKDPAEGKGNESPLKEDTRIGKGARVETKPKGDEEEDEPLTVPLEPKGNPATVRPAGLAVLVSLNKNFKDVVITGKADVVMGRHKSCQEECRFTSSHVSTKHCRFFVETTGSESTVVEPTPKKDKEEETKEDAEEESDLSSSSSTLPICMYGARCYRKNPGHFKQFRHPHLEGEAEDDSNKQGQEKEETKKNQEDGKGASVECNYRVVVEDLSTNGTFVNEQIVGKYKKLVLQHGDEISLVAPSSQLPNVSIEIAMYRLEYTP